MEKFELNLDSISKFGKSFFWAGFFLPSKNKNNAFKLYSVCRYFDDLADNESQDNSKDIQRAFDHIYNDKENSINIFFKSNNISLTILEDLVKGLIYDQGSFVIENEEDLITYSYRVAGTVGLMMMPILGVNSSEAKKNAIDLGIAMQLTNIARDIYEDAMMGRIYLPKSWIKDITIEDLVSKDLSIQKNQVVMDALEKLINLAEVFYQNGFNGLKFIPLKTRFYIFIASKIYKGISDKIKKQKFVYNQKRIYLNVMEKLLITVLAIPKFFTITSKSNRYQDIRKKFIHENL